MRVLIIGTGYTGLPLGTYLTKQGHEVIGTQTSKREESASFPIHKYNIENPSHLREILDNYGWLSGEKIALVFTAGPPYSGDVSADLEPFVSFNKQLMGNRFLNYIYIGSTSVYGDADGNWVDESSEMDPISGSGRLKMKAENHLVDEFDDLPVIRIRPGGIYGPGRNSMERYLSDEYELVGDGDRWSNRIHVDDLVQILALFCSVEQNESVNAVDGNPVKLKEIIEYLYSQTGRDLDEIQYISWEEAEESYSEIRLGLLKANKRVSSVKLTDGYDYNFIYPTVFDGLKQLIRDYDKK